MKQSQQVFRALIKIDKNCANRRPKTAFWKYYKFFSLTISDLDYCTTREKSFVFFFCFQVK